MTDNTPSDRFDRLLKAMATQPSPSQQGVGTLATRVQASRMLPEVLPELELPKVGLEPSPIQGSRSAAHNRKAIRLASEPPISRPAAKGDTSRR